MFRCARVRPNRFLAALLPPLTASLVLAQIGPPAPEPYKVQRRDFNGNVWTFTAAGAFDVSGDGVPEHIVGVLDPRGLDYSTGRVFAIDAANGRPVRVLDQGGPTFGYAVYIHNDMDGDGVVDENDTVDVLQASGSMLWMPPDAELFDSLMRWSAFPPFVGIPFTGATGNSIVD